MINPLLDFVIRLLTLILFIYWQFYWIITEKVADKEKPKSPMTRQIWFLRKASSGIIGIVLGLQLFALPILPLPLSPLVLYSLQIIGFALVVTGVSVAISARRALGTNWAHAYEYQIKQKHELVTDGIYGSIRHPIYTGLMLGILGGELVVGSYLVFGVILLALFGYIQAKREEKLLTSHFGESYKHYMKRTKMFFPYLW